ncbi:MAG TPA: hypothetical protein ENJ19_04230 [Gammaproteobacteria bacterium]|nr:hypothetical protein [Gammaproteobacteria bacterium]
MMSRKNSIAAVLGLILLSAGGPASACEVAGPNKHVGKVMAIDTKAGTFTLLDAETRSPITFHASTDLLRQVGHAMGQVMVSYEEKAAGLVALDLHF